MHGATQARNCTDGAIAFGQNVAAADLSQWPLPRPALHIQPMAIEAQCAQLAGADLRGTRIQRNRLPTVALGGDLRALDVELAFIHQTHGDAIARGDDRSFHAGLAITLVDVDAGALTDQLAVAQSQFRTFGHVDAEMPGQINTVQQQRTSTSRGETDCAGVLTARVDGAAMDFDVASHIQPDAGALMTQIDPQIFEHRLAAHRHQRTVRARATGTDLDVAQYRVRTHGNPQRVARAVLFDAQVLSRHGAALHMDAIGIAVDLQMAVAQRKVAIAHLHAVAAGAMSDDADPGRGHAGPGRRDAH